MTGFSSPLPEPHSIDLSTTYNTSEAGSLLALTLTNLPFVARRAFIVSNVPAGVTRGAHAHRTCEQFLVSLSGQIRVKLFDGHHTSDTLLHDPGDSLHLPAMVWGEQTYLDEAAQLLVFASHEYDPADYIDNVQEFLENCA